MTFYVTFKVDARFMAQVDADNIESAIHEATLRFYDADFGEAEDIDGDVVSAEDENGKFVYEK